MDEFLHLMSNPAHWAFEFVTDGFVFIAGLLVPERYNPAKRLLARHDREKHGGWNGPI